MKPMHATEPSRRTEDGQVGLTVRHPFTGDEWADRILELETLGDERRAIAVDDCCCRGEGPDELLRRSSCKLRVCPACADCLAMRLRERIDESLARMHAASWLRLRVPASALEELPSTWDLARAALVRLRTDKMAGVTRAVGRIAVSWRRSFPFGVVAIDLVFQGVLDEQSSRRFWRALTGGRGLLEVIRSHVARPSTLLPHLSDPRRWFPPPRSRSLAQLEAQWATQHGRRLIIEWLRPLKHHVAIPSLTPRRDP